jgi:hypothetical protein
MALAKTTDPVSPKRGMRRVLLLPGMGHLATTTILPRATCIFVVVHGARGVLEEVFVVVGAMVHGEERDIYGEAQKIENSNGLQGSTLN